MQFSKLSVSVVQNFRRFQILFSIKALTANTANSRRITALKSMFSLPLDFDCYLDRWSPNTFSPRTNNKMQELLVFLLAMSSIALIEGHGRLRVPPARTSMWRDGFNTTRNYDDAQLNCGGFNVRIILFILINLCVYLNGDMNEWTMSLF